MRTPRDGTVPAPPPRPPAALRNVVLVGPSGAGKTTLLDALLHAAGVLPRAGDVQDGSTVADAEAVEQRLGRSLLLAAAAFEHDGCTVTLLDVPGDPDLVGAQQAGLRAADAALFVVSAAHGLDAATAALWSECEASGLPRAVVVTQLDRARADFDDAVALCQRLLGEDVLPLHLPVHEDDGAVGGVLSLLDQRIADSTSGERTVRAADPEHVALVADLRAELVEAVLAESEDEALLDAYLDGEEPEPSVLRRELGTALARGHLTPVLPCAPLAGVGLVELLDLLVALPSPLDHPAPPVTAPDGSPAAPLVCDPDGPLAAQVVRAAPGPDGQRVSLVRVFSGTLRPGSGIASLASPLGALMRPVDACPAGGVCAVTGLVASTGETLSSPDAPMRIAAWPLPEPQHPVGVEAGEGLAEALAELVAEDPSARHEHRADTGQVLLWCQGPLHAEVLLDRLRARGLEVRTSDVVVPVRESADGGLHEPWSQVEVQVPTAFARSVVSDLRGRRARDVDSAVDPDDEDRSAVRAALPDRELLGYAVALRAVSHGTGRFTRSGLESAPAQD